MKIYIGERIRDIIFTKEYLFLFLEDTSSIGRIDFKNYDFSKL